MRKLIASVALVTAVAVGALAVAAVNPLHLVSAKASSPTTTTVAPGSPKPDNGDKAGKAGKAGKRGHFAGKLLDDALASLVKKGTITKDQAAAVKKAIQDQVKAAAKEHKGDHEGRDKGDHQRGLGKGMREGVLATVAKTIGVSPGDLLKALKSGKSIAQVAQAKGVDVQKVQGAIVTAANAKIDAAVKAGKLDAAKAAKLKQRLPEMAKRIVNKVPGQGGHRPGG